METVQKQPKRLALAKDLTEEEWAYIAGIFDGEGSIVKRRTVTSDSYAIHIVQKERELLRWLQIRLGGGVYGDKQNCGRWATNRRENVVKISQGMLPYLIVKQEKVRTALIQLGEDTYRNRPRAA